MKNSTSNTRIRTLITELGISQTEFCNKTGITKSALSNYLNGERQPRQDQLDKISKAFNINPSWLMGYDVPMKPLDETMYYEIMAQDKFRHDAKRLVEYARRFSKLFEAAEKCNQEQIDLATQMLNNFKKEKEDDK